MTTTVPDLVAVRDALIGVYGDGSMVTSLAEHLVKSWPKFLAEEADGWHTVEHSVHLTIWNWFPGGSTAEMAAGRVMASLTEASS